MDYYKVLELPRTASLDDVRKAYRRLSLKWHPDKNPDKQEEANRKFKHISEAYQVLSDDRRRKTYDAKTRGHSSSSGDSGKDGDNEPRTKRHKTEYSWEGSFKGNGSSFGDASFTDPDDVFKEFFKPPTGFEGDFLFTTSNGFGGDFFKSSAQFGENYSFKTTITTSLSSTSTTIQIQNGKRITTTKVIKDGKETVTITEEDI